MLNALTWCRIIRYI